MSVTMEDIKKVAKLARIMVKEEKAEELRKSLNDVLHFVEQLSEVDCSKIDNSVQYATRLHEREDVSIVADPSVMDNAPCKEGNMFVVPKVIS